MIFYLHDNQLYPTQASAPKPYEQVDVPVSKTELMAYVNALMVTPAAPDPLPIEVATQHPHYGEPVCEACARTRAGAKAMAGHIDLTTIYDLIDLVRDAPVLLENIKAYVAEL